MLGDGSLYCCLNHPEAVLRLLINLVKCSAVKPFLLMMIFASILRKRVSPVISVHLLL